jgi:trans-2,3-dihydro-3-hydroxyanthranilate isomerase
VEGYPNGPLHVFVALADEAAVAALSPDLGALAALGGSLGVSCFAGAGDRYKTRMFAPSLGVPEDPATGSAAGPLALHLVRHGRLEYGREIELRQGAEIGRPSLLRARVEGGPAGVERVVVGGGAVEVASGSYRLR